MISGVMGLALFGISGVLAEEDPGIYIPSPHLPELQDMLNQENFTLQEVGIFSSLDVSGNAVIKGSLLTGASNLELNYAGIGDRYSYIDFHSDDVNTDFSARLLRAPGENGMLILGNKGNGDIAIGDVGYGAYGNDIWIGRGTGAGNVNSQTKLKINTYYWNDRNAYISTAPENGQAGIKFETHNGINPVQTMFLGSTGNVGIGTTTPTTKLHISNNGIDSKLATFRNSSGFSGIDIGRDGGGIVFRDFGSYHAAIYYSDTTPTDTFFITGDTRKFGDSDYGTVNLSLDGKMGIGTANPSQELDVVGNIKLSGSIVSDGSICIGKCQ